PNTLIVITADHSTGGLTLGRDGEYAWFSENVMKIQASIAKMTKDLLALDEDEWRNYVDSQLNLELADTHWQTFENAMLVDDTDEREEAISAALIYATADLTGTGWTTSGHTGVDVPVMAKGPYADEFWGYQDHTDIAKVLLGLIK